MLVPQMSVHLHGQSAADFMPEPTTDGGNVDTRFNAPGCKKVAQIVVGDTGHADDLRGPVHRLLAFSHTHHRARRPCLSTLLLQTFKEFPHLWDYRHLSNFPGTSVFEPSFGMTREHNGATFEVTVRAHHICVSGFPEPAISHEANQVGTMLGFAAPASFDLGNEFVKLLIIWQNRIFAVPLSRIMPKAGLLDRKSTRLN